MKVKVKWSKSLTGGAGGTKDDGLANKGLQSPVEQREGPDPCQDGLDCTRQPEYKMEFPSRCRLGGDSRQLCHAEEMAAKMASSAKSRWEVAGRPSHRAAPRDSSGAPF